MLYIYIFSGGFSDFSSFDFSTVTSPKLITYGLETFSAAFLEEVLFRGLFLGLLLLSYQEKNNFILKSVIVSGVLFGLLHIINIWTQPYPVTTKGVFNQVYAAACLGVMYAATYLKTRSIIILGLLHFASNFFAGIGELTSPENLPATMIRDKTTIEIIAAEIVRLVIFGIPLLIGLFILRLTNEKDTTELGLMPYNPAQY